MALILTVAAVVLTPIGPIFLYGSLVPIIHPIIPKPNDVPPRARAEYHWKGFGLVWYWEDQLTNGCAKWWAADGISGPVRGLEVYEGGERCDGGEQIMSRLSFMNHTRFGKEPNDWRYEECPYNLSASSVARYRGHIEQLRTINSAPIQRGMLDAMLLELKGASSLDLRAQQFGCSIDQS